eukprot:gene4138-2774_t
MGFEETLTATTASHCYEASQCHSDALVKMQTIGSCLDAGFCQWVSTYTRGSYPPASWFTHRAVTAHEVLAMQFPRPVRVWAKGGCGDADPPTHFPTAAGLRQGYGFRVGERPQDAAECFETQCRSPSPTDCMPDISGDPMIMLQYGSCADVGFCSPLKVYPGRTHPRYQTDTRRIKVWGPGGCDVEVFPATEYPAEPIL